MPLREHVYSILIVSASEKFNAALRPLLGEARQKKLDEASKILKLLHLLPLLKESGVLQNIL